ncbi:uncharacterized protein LOC118183034, partial [Stegodyphus dumicola]|uniref:uncharacterized protein LOC118183034 n=1 Tax=Stegodyphus dumicola TaxID=202533 RepID=UPI0015B0E4AA
ACWVHSFISPFRVDYAANDECIRKVVDDYFSFYLEEANDTYNAYREKTEASTESPFQERSDHEKAENRECLKTSLAVHWLLKEIHDSCSPEARHVMLKLLRKSDYFRYLCGEHDILELQNSFTKFVRKTQTKEEREMMRETFHFEHP